MISLWSFILILLKIIAFYVQHFLGGILKKLIICRFFLINSNTTFNIVIFAFFFVKVIHFEPNDNDRHPKIAENDVNNKTDESINCNDVDANKYENASVDTNPRRHSWRISLENSLNEFWATMNINDENKRNWSQKEVKFSYI